METRVARPGGQQETWWGSRSLCDMKGTARGSVTSSPRDKGTENQKIKGGYEWRGQGGLSAQAVYGHTG